VYYGLRLRPFVPFEYTLLIKKKLTNQWCNDLDTKVLRYYFLSFLTSVFPLCVCF